MIEIRNVSKSFGKKNIFHNLSFSIEDGEFIGIKGKSGSGKSTLLNIMGFLENFDDGSIILDGEEVGPNDIKKTRLLRKNKIGYLFQNFALIDDFSVYENLEIGLSIRKKKAKIAAIKHVLADLGLEVDLNQKIYTLSGGEQQRIALARVILQNKPILLADEPTASVDYENREIILCVLDELCRSGKTIIFVSHDDYVLSKAHRIILLGN